MLLRIYLSKTWSNHIYLNVLEQRFQQECCILQWCPSMGVSANDTEFIPVLGPEESCGKCKV